MSTEAVDNPLADSMGAAIERIEAIEQPQEAPERPQERTEEPEAPEAPTEEQEPAEDVPEDDDWRPVISDVKGLAEYLRVDPGELYRLEVPVTTPDGGRTNVPLGELKDGWQASQKAAALRDDLKAQRTAFEQRAQQAEQVDRELQAKLNEVQLMTQALQAELNRQPRDEADARDLQERARHLAAIRERTHAITNHQRLAAQIRAQEQAALQFVTGADALFSAFPEWRNPETYKADTDALRHYLTVEGFQPQEVDTIADARLIKMANKARLYDAKMANIDAAKKKVKAVQKRILKPGARQARAKGTDTTGLRRALRKSGHVNDAAALIAAIER